LISTSDKSDSVEKYLNIQYKDDIEKRDHQIKSLTESLEALKLEMTQMKKRNQQLAFILLQGEMKEKSQLIKEVEELSTIKNELTTQVVELNAALEQEKSKVHHFEIDQAKKIKTKH